MIATHYEGDGPDHVAKMWEDLQKIEDPTYLSNMKYAAFALGDLTYKHYCGFGKKFSKKLTDLGATLVYELGLGSNDQNKIETYFLKWKEGVWADVCANVSLKTEEQVEGEASKFIVQLEDGSQETPIDSLQGAQDYDVNSSVMLFSSEIHQRIRCENCAG